MRATIYIVAIHEVKGKIIQLQDIDAVLYNGERFLHETTVNGASFATMPTEAGSSLPIAFSFVEGAVSEGFFFTEEHENTGNELEALRGF